MSKIRSILERIDKRMNRIGGPLTLKLVSKSQKLSRGDILRLCEEIEDIAKTDVVALRAEAGLPLAADRARR